MNISFFNAKEWHFPILSLPILGSIVFLMKRKKTPEMYTIFLVGVLLYAYAFISILLLFLMKEVFPYFLENFLMIIFQLNKFGIVLSFLALAVSDVFGWTDRWVRKIPGLDKIRKILMA